MRDKNKKRTATLKNKPIRKSRKDTQCVDLMQERQNQKIDNF